MLHQSLEALAKVNSFLWGYPMILLLLFVHIFFTLYLHFIQKHTGHAIRLSIEPPEESKGARSQGLSGFAALSTTLAATLGTGNIIGVSTAVALGGPGAVFWCWITGFLGMATAYAESFLCLKYRVKQNGQLQGGPMYLLKNALGMPKLSIFYACCLVAASFGIGVTTQIRAVSSHLWHLSHISTSLTGIFAALIIGLVIVGGIKSIGKFCTRVVPILGSIYLLCCFFLLFLEYDAILPAIRLIFADAFSLKGVSAGLLGGTIGMALQKGMGGTFPLTSPTLLQSMRYGIARGLFSNEVGLGSTGIAAASSGEKDIKKQAFISMTAAFWDTVVMCAITGIVIVVCLLKHPASFAGYDATGLTSAAFRALPFYGENLLVFCLTGFAVTTMIGWYYFGEQGITFLFGEKGKKPYQFLYLLMIYAGAVMSLELIWEMADFCNVLLILPNLYALFKLRREIKN